jgi:hypothetical protein
MKVPDRPPWDRLMAVNDIAGLWKVSVQRVRIVAQRDDFPQPAWTTPTVGLTRHHTL